MERSDSSQSSAEKDRQTKIRQILTVLHKWGIHTIGQLAALDKQQLGARLGPEAIRVGAGKWTIQQSNQTDPAPGVIRGEFRI